MSRFFPRVLDDPHTVLKWSLLAGAAYFLGVSAAHFFGCKVPFFYVYYDLPSTLYQDKIISFAMLGWSLFYVAGYSSVKRGSLRSVRYIVMAGAGAIAGLGLLNVFGGLETVSPEANFRSYWIQTAVLAAFVAWIAALYVLAKRE